MIKLENLSFSYRENSVLQNFSFSFEPGQFYGIFGKNGSGKSTLMKLITGELAPSDGAVSPRFRSPMDRARTIAFMEQQYPERIPLTVQETVELGNYPWRNKSDSFSVEPILKQLDLLELRNRCYSTLSGGEKQRVMLARILAQQTPVLLLDEPFSSFDYGNQHHFYGILKETARQGKCVVMITHDVFVSREYLDTALLLKDGVLFHSGTPADCLTEKNLEEIY